MPGDASQPALSLRHDDVSIDAALVRRLLAAQFPQWAELPIAPVTSPGVDNVTYRLGGGMSVRLPRCARWVGQVAREQWWLPRLAPHLPLPVPVPLAMGAPGEGYPFPWSVYRWLDGENAALARIADPRQAAADLAGFIAALQPGQELRVVAGLGGQGQCLLHGRGPAVAGGAGGCPLRAERAREQLAPHSA
jgi:Phosphotransferase enzyme family